MLEPWGASGIALASSIAWLGEALVMLLLLRQEIAGLDLKELGFFTLKVLTASAFAVLCAALAYLLGELLLPSVGPHSIIEMLKLIGRLSVSILVGGGIYFLIAHLLRIDSVLPLDRVFKRVFRRGR